METRKIRWNDLLEAKKSINIFGKSLDMQERRIAEIDKAFYLRNINNYVA